MILLLLSEESHGESMAVLVNLFSVPPRIDLVQRWHKSQNRSSYDFENRSMMCHGAATMAHSADIPKVDRSQFSQICALLYKMPLPRI